MKLLTMGTVLLFAVTVSAGNIGQSGRGLYCDSDLSGVTCCEFLTLADTELTGATRPKRVASCANGETFFLEIPFFPDTSGINWTVQIDCSFNASETGECCFDMTSSVPIMSTGSEREVIDEDFGNAIEILSAAITVTPAYDDWIRTSSDSFIPYNSTSNTDCATNTCRKMPVTLKFTRDDSNTSCSPPSTAENVVGNVFLTTD